MSRVPDFGVVVVFGVVVRAVFLKPQCVALTLYVG
jgi:hypothetical protein